MLHGTQCMWLLKLETLRESEDNGRNRYFCIRFWTFLKMGLVYLPDTLLQSLLKLHLTSFRKIDNYPALQVTYTKRRDGIVKKAKELSVLCDTDVGLLMFSPSGKLTKYSSSRRIEDIFLRFICDEKQEPLENEDHLYRSLVHSKCEGEMLDLIKKKEELEKKLIELCERQFDAEEKMSFYQPKVENITTIHEAVDHEKFLNSAIRRVEKLNAKLLQKESASRIPESIELEAASFFDGNEVPVPPNSKKKRRNPSMCEYHHARTNSPTSLNPKIQYLNKEGHWILESGWAME